MRLIPVLDLQSGVVVRGVAGKRDEYRPLSSELCPGARPLDVARAIRETYNVSELYVADLDAIAGDRDVHEAVLVRLVDAGFRLLLDSGITCAHDARRAGETGADRIVVGLETCAGPEALAEILQQLGADRVLFSLDLMRGQPLLPPGTAGWQELTPPEIVSEVFAAGVGSLIVLDLAGVGVGGGLPTLSLCREIRNRFPSHELLTGGGIAASEHLEDARSAGIDGLLVASALHQGPLRDRLQTMSRRELL